MTRALLVWQDPRRLCAYARSALQVIEPVSCEFIQQELCIVSPATGLPCEPGLLCEPGSPDSAQLEPVAWPSAWASVLRFGGRVS